MAREQSSQAVDREGHTKIRDGRWMCVTWDEVVDFDLDPWDKEDDCPWCGEPWREDDGAE